MANSDFNAEADPHAAASLKYLQRVDSSESKTLTQLDRMRQQAWKRFNRSDDPGILEVIGAIDDLLESRASTSALMGKARDAHKVFSKTQVLDNAFDRAKRQTDRAAIS